MHSHTHLRRIACRNPMRIGMRCLVQLILSTPTRWHLRPRIPGGPSQGAKRMAHSLVPIKDKALNTLCNPRSIYARSLKTKNTKKRRKEAKKITISKPQNERRGFPSQHRVFFVLFPGTPPTYVLAVCIHYFPCKCLYSTPHTDRSA